MNTNEPNQGRGDALVVDPALAPPEGPEIMFTGCDTSQNGCAGIAYFRNNTGQSISHVIWFRHGGQSNFVLGSGQTHSIHVQTGDTYSSAWGNNGVPNGSARYWIKVG
jgi:hypothetical protein